MANIALFFGLTRNKGSGKDDLISDGSCKGCAVLPSLSRQATRLGSKSKNQLQDAGLTSIERVNAWFKKSWMSGKIFQQETLDSRRTVLTSVVDP